MENILQYITQALGWSILHSLWQGTLVYILACITIIAFPKASAQFKHTVALISQHIIFAAFVTTFCLMLNIKNTITIPHTAIQSLQQSQGASMAALLNQYLSSVLPWFSSLYIVGILIQIIIVTHAYTRLHFIRKHGTEEVPPLWRELFNELKQTITIKPNVKFYLSSKVTVPLTIGYFKPIILFPIALVNNLDIKHVESILLHELAHIRRHDYLLNFIKIIIETILFFNPFIWLLSRKIESERENACDDFVVGYTGTPIAYAQALMSVELLRADLPSPYAMAATNNKHSLLTRIKRITKMERKYTRLKQDLLAVGLCTLTLAIIACSAPRKATHQEITSVKTTQRTNKQTNSIKPVEEITQVMVTRAEPKAAIQPVQPKQSRKEKMLEEELKQSTLEIQETFNSEDWKQQIKNIQEESFQAAKAATSPQLQQTIKSITDQALELANVFQSEDYLSLLADAEKNADKIAEFTESPAFKAKIANIEQQSKKIEDYYSSPEWTEKVKKIEENALQIEEYFESPEWNEKIRKIEENAKKIEDHYNKQQNRKN